MTKLVRTVHTATGFDTRDEADGGFIGMGLVFSLSGTSDRVVWSINTGWALRPITGTRLVPGRQRRSPQPGVDHAIATGFPQAYRAVLIADGADPQTEPTDLPLDPKQLLHTLLSSGDEAVFDMLEAAYFAASSKDEHQV